MSTIDNLFHLLHTNLGSDLHLSAGSPPVLRIYGDLVRVDAPAVSSEELMAVLREMVPMERVQAFEQSGDLDFAYEIPGLARYRANFFRQNRGVAAVFREIPQRINSVEELGLPPMLRELALLPKGLVLVTGPTGSGKSTTLAALVDYANTHRHDHIITIEDPIEFVHRPKSCLVNQREIGRDSRTFGTALRAALREDPDIILVGEMRDLETISLALEAAETGHLVFATLHTISASKTLDRIIEVFPAQEQAQVRTSLSESIQAIVAQTLFKRADGKGRVPALEILFGIPSVRNMIRENKTFQLPSVLQTNRNAGMQTMDDDIERLLAQRAITPEAALVHAQDKSRIRESIAHRR
ncbi:MAG TPA: type IV pilus twitching motility protein PilT [Candidatus Bilophila faecipullorum]|uniref:Type IV pilus twitching motility protein PilT n=1 Tax=Candidatus Bilophila faecipullorum TaxID=2838482 RepID=A0A9D1UB25_9BACT|nr:type IV pilus twitching motility protein PilT [uncultured Bilophila sp.]HIW79875.1 type IV pilus twitching motility protein PilT [Candidatus Bilophila faecipullorum]